MTPALTLALLLGASAAGPDELFLGGIAARSDGVRARELFRRAAAEWESEAVGRDTPELCRKRAKAHRLAGDTPRAVAALRAGLALDPDDADLRNGLASVRGELLYPPGSAPPDPPAPTLSSLGLVLVALAGTGLVALGARRRAVALTALGGALWLACAGVTVRDDAARRSFRSERVRVLAVRTTARAGNAASYPPRLDLPLPAGAEVRPLAERGGWELVEWGDGAAGWVPADSLLP